MGYVDTKSVNSSVSTRIDLILVPVSVRVSNFLFFLSSFAFVLHSFMLLFSISVSSS